MRRPLVVITITFLLAGLIVVRPQAPPQASGASAATTLDDIIFVATPHVSPPAAMPRLPEGSRIMRLSRSTGRIPVNLTPEFFAAADPQVSFDGTQILFAAQKTKGSLWQIWEMSADGSNKHQIINCRGNCFRPAYLPIGDVVYTVATEQNGHSESNLAVSRTDGSQERFITFGPGNYQLETVLDDGRLLVSASWPLQPNVRRANSRSLYALRPDGSGLELLRADLVDNALAADAEELDDSSFIFVKTPAGAFGGGLALVRRAHAHPTSLAPPGSMCRSPRRLTGNQFIAACAISDDDAVPKFDLYVSEVAQPDFTTKIYGDLQLSSLQAVPLEPRNRPRILWSTLKAEARAGYFIALNSYRSADFPNGRVPGSIDGVRVLSFDLKSGRENILGNAPVESDGSFYIAVPADQPVRFELLDRAGHVLKSQEGWVWSRGGEQRACVGCHEEKAIAPENHWPLALRRFDSPIQIGVKDVAPLAPE